MNPCSRGRSPGPGAVVGEDLEQETADFVQESFAAPAPAPAAPAAAPAPAAVDWQEMLVSWPAALNEVGQLLVEALNTCCLSAVHAAELVIVVAVDIVVVADNKELVVVPVHHIEGLVGAVHHNREPETEASAPDIVLEDIVVELELAHNIALVVVPAAVVAVDVAVVEKIDHFAAENMDS